MGILSSSIRVTSAASFLAVAASATSAEAIDLVVTDGAVGSLGNATIGTNEAVISRGTDSFNFGDTLVVGGGSSSSGAVGGGVRALTSFVFQVESFSASNSAGPIGYLITIDASGSAVVDPGVDGFVNVQTDTETEGADGIFFDFTSSEPIPFVVAGQNQFFSGAYLTPSGGNAGVSSGVLSTGTHRIDLFLNASANTSNRISEFDWSWQLAVGTVPEPATLGMLCGLAGFGLLRRK
jgi:hypothetical protein